MMVEISPSLIPLAGKKYRLTVIIFYDWPSKSMMSENCLIYMQNHASVSIQKRLLKIIKKYSISPICGTLAGFDITNHDQSKFSQYLCKYLLILMLTLGVYGFF